MKRRGIIAALLAPLAEAQVQVSSPNPFIDLLSTRPMSLTLVLPNNKPDSPCLTVTALGRTVTLTTQEVMDALEGK